METSQLLLTLAPAPERQFLDFPFRADAPVTALTVPSALISRPTAKQARPMRQLAPRHRNLN